MAGDSQYLDDGGKEDEKALLSSPSSAPLLPTAGTAHAATRRARQPSRLTKGLIVIAAFLLVWTTYGHVALFASSSIAAAKHFYEDAVASSGIPLPCRLFGHHHHHPPPHTHQHDPARNAIKGMLSGLFGPPVGHGAEAEQAKGKGGLKEYYASAREHEQAFLKVPSPESAREALRRYTDKLHVAGSERDFESALQIQKEWADLLGAPEKDPKQLLFDAGSADSIHYLTGDWSVPVEGSHPPSADDHRRPPPPPQPRQPGSPRVWTDTYYIWLNNAEAKSSLSFGPAPTEDQPKPAPEWEATLEEDVLEKDPTSGQGNLPFHGYSKPGSASGPIVYAGFCTVDDFATLKKKGVKVEGAITLCRYGGNFRGLKVRASADAGAVGTLIYSDPLEDGNITEENGYKAYPDGPARQKSSVQRGSVQGLSFYPGDPSTPFEPSYKNASRLRIEDADSLPKIPSLPVSYADAAVLLNKLKGQGVSADELEQDSHGKEAWKGKVPGVEEYWTGPSAPDTVAYMNNAVSQVNVQPIWNTYAFIPGHIQDEVVITGVHRDAWTFGGADPSSGTAAMHEVVAGLGSLTRSGWKPLRSILIASWDAEEYGLVGSTEFGEDYAAWLQRHAVAYFNTDVAAAGSKLKIGASPSLAQLYRDIGAEVEDPESKDGKKIQIDKVAPLGSGSDFSVFLQHLGIPSSDIGYAGNSSVDPVYHYHSNYDSFYWMEHYGDPGFKRITTIAKLIGTAVMRTSQAIFLPLDADEYSSTIGQYLDSAEKEYKKAVQRKIISPARAPEQSFALVEKSLKHLQTAAKKLSDEHKKLERDLDRSLRHQDRHRRPPGGRRPGHPDDGRAPREDRHDLRHDHSDEHHGRHHPHGPHRHHGPPRHIVDLLRRIASYNFKLSHYEQSFVHPDGLRLRPWYRSLLVGPGRWRGYGATSLPGIKESITLDHDVKALQWELKRFGEAIQHATRLLLFRGRAGPPRHGPPRGDEPDGRKPPHHGHGHGPGHHGEKKPSPPPHGPGHHGERPPPPPPPGSPHHG